jgi:hypothetical protein
MTFVESIAAAGGPAVLNPVSDWAVMLTPRHRYSISPSLVVSRVDQLVGALRAEIADAEMVERTLAGRVARIVRFPSDVREAAGLDSKSRSGQAVQGLVSALLVTVVGGVIVGIILALLHLA